MVCSELDFSGSMWFRVLDHGSVRFICISVPGECDNKPYIRNVNELPCKNVDILLDLDQTFSLLTSIPIPITIIAPRYHHDIKSNWFRPFDKLQASNSQASNGQWRGPFGCVVDVNKNYNWDDSISTTWPWFNFYFSKRVIITVSYQNRMFIHHQI